MILNKNTERRLNTIALYKKGGCFIFSGERGLGKGMAARQVAKRMLGISEGALVSPDYMELVPKDGIIKVEDITAVREFSAYLPQKSSVRVCVIDDANVMTEQAQNALLKTLEEANEKVIFLLVAHEVLLSTIISRSSKVSFSTLSESDMKELFPDVEDFILTMANGCPGKVYMFLEKKEFLSDCKKVLDTLENMKETREIFLSLSLMKEKDKNCFYDKYSRDELMAFVSLMHEIFVAALCRQDARSLNMKKFYTIENVLDISCALLEAYCKLKKKGQFSRNDFFDLIRGMV